MKHILLFLFLIAFTAFGQKKRERVPSYFGIQIRPIFPTQFIGSSTTSFQQNEGESVLYSSTIKQKMGFSFGGTVRAGLTKLIAIETGINFYQRNFGIDMEIPDSSIMATNDIRFVSYDIPLNALFYIKLAEKWYMNASIGVAVNFKPTDVAVVTKPGGDNEFQHIGVAQKKFGFDFNANVGFEFRTEKNGFFYLGGSANVPFKPLFDMILNYSNQGYESQVIEPVDGSYLSVDFKYFFPNIANKGTQFQQGPITQ